MVAWVFMHDGSHKSCEYEKLLSQGDRHVITEHLQKNLIVQNHNP